VQRLALAWRQVRGGAQGRYRECSVPQYIHTRVRQAQQVQLPSGYPLRARSRKGQKARRYSSPGKQAQHRGRRIEKRRRRVSPSRRASRRRRPPPPKRLAEEGGVRRRRRQSVRRCAVFRAPTPGAVAMLAGCRRGGGKVRQQHGGVCLKAAEPQRGSQPCLPGAPENAYAQNRKKLGGTVPV